MSEDLIKFISLEKLTPYLDEDKNIKKALELYEWNVKLSEAFYAPLNYFEVSLRNACNNEMIKERGESWYLDDSLMSGSNSEKGNYAKTKIQSSYQKLVGYNKKYILDTSINEIKNGDIIANLELSFWVNLFVYNYFNNFWNPCLKYVFKGYNRKVLHSKLNYIRELRNRIFHHENILKFDLNSNYLIILEILRAISGELENKVRQVSNFECIYNKYLEYKKGK